MNSVLFAVKDIKSGFVDPVSFRDEASAKASFVSFINQIHSQPDDFLVPYTDFQLWKLGVYDLDSGLIEPCLPSLILSGDSFNFKEVSYEE